MIDPLVQYASDFSKAYQKRLDEHVMTYFARNDGKPVCQDCAWRVNRYMTCALNLMKTAEPSSCDKYVHRELGGEHEQQDKV